MVGPFLPAAFAASPFVATELPAIAGFLSFTPFLSFPGFRPAFPFFLSLGCECQLTHWSPELGQRVVPPPAVPYRYRTVPPAMQVLVGEAARLPNGTQTSLNPLYDNYQTSILDNMGILVSSVQLCSGHPSINLAEPPPKAFRNASCRGSRVSIGRRNDTFTRIRVLILKRSRLTLRHARKTNSTGHSDLGRKGNLVSTILTIAGTGDNLRSKRYMGHRPYWTPVLPRL